MNPKTIELLEFPTIKSMLSEYTVSNLGKKLVASLAPKTSVSAVNDLLRETTEARLILEASGSPPLHGLSDLSELLQKVKIGSTIDPLGLQNIADFLRGCRKMKEYMLKRNELTPFIASYAFNLTIYHELEEEIDRCIIDGMVSSEASPGLKKVRKEISLLQEKIKAKLNRLVASAEAKTFLQEQVISVRDSRFVLMVKASARSKLPGIVLGSSGSGSTLFVEPLVIHQLCNELRVLEGKEQDEIYQILAGLSGEVLVRLPEIEQNLEIMAQYDFAFAKGRLSRVMQGVAPAMNGRNYIKLLQARHPLLSEKPVPLDFLIGQNYRSLVITGPNTGGKTVTLKTVGLLNLMAQSGLHIPAQVGTEIAVFQEILADIGDGQNITQSLSTFSSHITNIIEILKKAGPEALVLLDEVGTGTDPAEGSALAIAILEYLYRRGSITLASTHYPEIKHYAMTTSGFINGSMAFDREHLKPLYRLVIGRAGESNALWIAEKLGMPVEVINVAKEHLQPEEYAAETGEIFEEPIQPVLSESLSLLPKTKHVPAAEKSPPEPTVKIGDLVEIPYLEEKGVVCSSPDSKGRVRVLVKGKKMELQAKRVKLLIPAEQLYPEAYDLNIILLNKEERRLKKQIEKGITGISRIVSPDEQ